MTNPISNIHIHIVCSYMYIYVCVYAYTLEDIESVVSCVKTKFNDMLAYTFTS